MTEDALLNELCAICHLSPPKYKCPRCASQTCSLPCVKRHKLWSQCSGVRDPAAYKKRRQLATPSSIDQDFNFITHLERIIERAGDYALNRGIAGSEDRRKRVKGEARRDTEIHQRVGRIIKAPPGMSRALQNKTKWDNRQSSLIWTVEWFLDDGSRVLGNCRGSRTLAEAFANAVGDRKWNQAQIHCTKSVDRGRCPDPRVETANQIKDASDTSIANPEKVSASHVVSPYFYLHRPNLPSDNKCLIPLQAKDTIDDAVRDRVLIEFPTIFALSVSEVQLQKPFITENQYLEQQHPSGPAFARSDSFSQDKGESTAWLQGPKAPSTDESIESIEKQQHESKHVLENKVEYPRDSLVIESAVPDRTPSPFEIHGHGLQLNKAETFPSVAPKLTSELALEPDDLRQDKIIENTPRALAT